MKFLTNQITDCIFFSLQQHLPAHTYCWCAGNIHFSESMGIIICVDCSCRVSSKVQNIATATLQRFVNPSWLQIFQMTIIVMVQNGTSDKLHVNTCMLYKSTYIIMCVVLSKATFSYAIISFNFCSDFWVGALWS